MPSRGDHCCVPGSAPQSAMAPFYHLETPTSNQQYQPKILSNTAAATNRYAPYITHYGRIGDHSSPTQYA